MTHHRHRNPVPGPRRLALARRLHLRNALLSSGRRDNLTVMLARAANEAAEQRRARLNRGGDGDAPPMTGDRRADTYVRANGYDGATNRQLRQLVRKDETTSRSTHHAAMADEFGWTTPPKGRRTPQRPPISLKGRQS